MHRVMVLLILCLVSAYWMKAEPAFGKDIVHVEISVIVKWDTEEPGTGDEKQVWSEGILNYSITGTMIRNDSASPTVSKQGQFFSPVLNYDTEAMFAVYTYKEQILDNAPGCPLLAEYRGNGRGDITGGASLSVNMFSSMAASFYQNLSASEKQFAAQMQQSMSVPDYYVFTSGGPGRVGKLEGEKRTSLWGNSRCEYEDAEKSVPGISVSLQIKLPSSGVMEGTRTWSAEANGETPFFKIGICDVGDVTGSKPLNPAEGGKRNVTYTVRWHIGERLDASDDSGP